MAQFSPAYNQYVKPFEGGYAFDPADKGGETYAGISRVFNPTWKGWSYIDAEKMKRGVTKLPRNYIVPGVDKFVIEFYNNDMWNRYGFSAIKSQAIANLLFDTMVNHGPGNMQKIVAKAVTGDATQTLSIAKIIELVNSAANPEALHDAIKASREAFYNNIVKNDPTQSKFLAGWLKRVNSFPNLANGLKIGLPFFILFVLLFIALFS